MREEVKDSFDEISPVTGELAVLVEDSFRLDLSSGYQNMKDQWNIKNPEIIEAVEEQMPSYVIPFKFIDQTTGDIWYPMLAFKHTAVLFPIANELQGFVWGVSKVEKLVNKEDMNTHYVVNLPIQIQGREEMGLFRVNNLPQKVFDKKDFEQAYELYNSLGNEE